jgi:hypothetical protein
MAPFYAFAFYSAWIIGIFRVELVLLNTGFGFWELGNDEYGGIYEK